MSASTVLARKWRPQQFSEVVGQDPVVSALSQALTSGRLHHAYLFTGTRGVGKTTLARIFAKALNCRAGMSAQPCHDDIAQAIDAGNFVDLIEIDAASRTKVEDTRELLDNVQYAPSVGRFKIYIIDEVHMLSTHSFNALLKTLEEPPEHVKFLLATTDPHKLPVTILSRCLQFHLRPMTPQVLQDHLARVLTAEAIDFESTALELVVRMSGGSVRDALSLLDQAIMLGAGSVHYDATRDMLGLASDDQVNALLSALALQDQAQILSLLSDWVTWGADFDRLQQQLLEKIHRLAMLQSFPALLSDADTYLQSLSEQVSSEQVQIWLQVILLAQDDMRLAPTAQMGFEVMLMRLLHFVGQASTSPSPLKVVKPVQRAVATTALGHTSQSYAKPVEVSQPQVEDVALPSPGSHESPHLAALAALGIRKNIDTAEKKTLISEPVSSSELVESMPEAQLQSLFESPIATTAETPVPILDSLDPVTSVRVSDAEPWLLDDWKKCLIQWRLKGPELELANQCLRLKGKDDHEICLAYPQMAAANVAFWGDKLLNAIKQVEPQAVITWVSQWQADWLSPEGWVQQLKATELASIKAEIAQEPRFQQLAQAMGLVPQWDKLEPWHGDNQ